MPCHACEHQPRGACSRCGQFFCRDHLGTAGVRAMCGPCYSTTRPRKGAFGAAGIGLGVLLLWLALRSQSAGLPGLFGIWFLGMGAYFLYAAVRKFPPGPRPEPPPARDLFGQEDFE